MANCRNTQQLNINCGTDVVLHDRLIFDGETFDSSISVGIEANLVNSLGKRTPLEISVADSELIIDIPWVDGRNAGCYGLEVKGECNGRKWSTYADSLIRYTRATVEGPSEVEMEHDWYDVTQVVGYAYSDSPISKVTATVDDQVGIPNVDVTYEKKKLNFDFHNLRGIVGPVGPQGPQGDSVLVGQGDLPLTHALGYDNTKAISQIGVTEVINGIDNIYYEQYTNLTKDKYYNTASGYTTIHQDTQTGAYCIKIDCKPGDQFLLAGAGRIGSSEGAGKLYVWGVGTQTYYQRSASGLDYRNDPHVITAPAGEEKNPVTFLLINFIGYDSSTDYIKKITRSHTDGLADEMANVVLSVYETDEMTPQSVDSGKTLAVGGELVDSSSTSVVNTYVVDMSKSYYVTCRVPKSTENCAICFYDSGGTLIAPLYIGDGETNAYDKVKVHIIPPQGTGLMKIYGSMLYNAPTAYEVGDIIEVNDALRKLDKVDENAILVGYSLKNDGELATSTVNAVIKTYNNVDVTKTYCATCRIGKNTTSAAICYYDSDGDFISPQFVGDGINNAHNEIKIPISLPEGTAIIKVFGQAQQEPMLYINEGLLDLSEMYNDIKKVKKHPLFGKKVAVIGDSISTIYDGNTPYIRIQDGDIGHTIQSYVSWNDVYNGNSGVRTDPTNKTIGGVTLTEAMIDGELHEFTPIAEDVGKELFVPRHYSGNTSSVKVWSQVLCEKTGATLIANASFSGSSINSSETIGRGVMFTASHAWHLCTIGRCKTRDEEGNDVVPDVIIIARGTNDFSYTDNGDFPHLILDFPELLNGFAATDDKVSDGVYNFATAYMMTIQALRTAYPKATIICATPNVFKRVQYDVWPTRNDAYTLPQICGSIRKIADYMGCGLIEFDKDGITFENCYPDYISDSAVTPTHPNANGHRVMGEKAVADLNYVLNVWAI